MCITLTNSMFMKGYSQIKVQVKFNSDFHRDRNQAKSEKKAQIEDDPFLHHSEHDPEGGMMGITGLPEMSQLTHGHFIPIRKKINKIYKRILEIKELQSFERAQEEKYENNQIRLSSSFFWLSVF